LQLALLNERKTNMHTLTLVTVEIPDMTQISDVTENFRMFAETVAEKLNEHDPDSICAELISRRLNCRRDAFSAAVDDALAEKMEPFCECPNDDRYLEFINLSESIKEEYESGSDDFFRFPQGTFVPTCYHPEYCIRDGMVYQRKAGQLHHEMRTKKAKKMKAFEKYPFKKAYKSMADYAERYCYHDYHEEQQAYGYYTNPNSFWDWYAIGGRWPTQFLVKEGCTEYSIGDRSCRDEVGLPTPPAGYVWAVAARKKDIEWQVQYDWGKKRMTEQFHLLENCFRNGTIPGGMCAVLSENGIGFLGEMYYIKDETLEENLKRNGYGEKPEYYASAGAFLDIDDCYCDRYDILGPNSDSNAWRNQLKKFYEKIDDNTVIVGVDCHV